MIERRTHVARPLASPIEVQQSSAHHFYDHATDEVLMKSITGTAGTYRFSMHPLDLFDRFRRWFGWALPGRQPWDRKPGQVAPERPDDWLLEPPSLEEARLLFPQLDEERALLRYQQLRLEMRERDGRGF